MSHFQHVTEETKEGIKDFVWGKPSAVHTDTHTHTRVVWWYSESEAKHEKPFWEIDIPPRTYVPQLDELL